MYVYLTHACIPTGRKLHPEAFTINSQSMYIARVGADKVPNTVKPWRYDLVFTKEDPTGVFYVCVYMPYAKPAAKSKKSKTTNYTAPPSAVTGEARGDAESVSGSDARCPELSVNTEISILVEALFQRAHAAGFLTQVSLSMSLALCKHTCVMIFCLHPITCKLSLLQARERSFSNCTLTVIH